MPEFGVELHVQTRISQLVSGVTTAPTLHHLTRGGVLERLPGPSECGIEVGALAAAVNPTIPHHNLGSILAALRMLAFQGWVDLAGADESARVRLTPRGVIAAGLAREHAATFAAVIATARHGKDAHVAFREPEEPHREAVTALCELARRCARRWDIPDASGPAQDVVEQVRGHLDGFALSPVMVALSMPRHERDGSRIQVTDGTLFERFEDRRLTVVPTPPNWHTGLLHAGLELMAAAGLGGFDGSAFVLDDLGAGLVAQAASFGGPVSYLRSYAELDQILYGNADPLGIEADGHVDRVMNIWTSFHHTVFWLGRRRMCTSVMQRVFDDPNLDRQPVGVADMGCGSGESIKQIVDYIIGSTRRGKHLVTHPLVVIGADFFEGPRDRARETFQSLRRVEGVIPHVLAGDVTDPDGYDATIRELGLETVDWRTGRRRRVGARDFLHTLMFLSHDRELRITSREQAMALVETSLERTDRELLRQAVEACAGEPVQLPEDAHELARLVAGQFTTGHSDKGRLVPALISAADLVAFMGRWRPHLVHGLVLLELHTIRPRDGRTAPARDLTADRLGCADAASAAWGMHFVSRQFLLPKTDHELALLLAGFRPMVCEPVVTPVVSVGWWTRSDVARR